MIRLKIALWCAETIQRNILDIVKSGQLREKSTYRGCMGTERNRCLATISGPWFRYLPRQRVAQDSRRLERQCLRIGHIEVQILLRTVRLRNQRHLNFRLGNGCRALCRSPDAEASQFEARQIEAEARQSKILVVCLA